jgi:hypothetical protein
MRIFFLLAIWATPIVAHPGSAIVVDRQGHVYFVDTGSGIYKIGGDGRLERQRGPAFHWMAIDGDNSFAATSLPTTQDAELTKVGANPMLILSSDFPVVVGADRAFYYPELGGDGRLRVIRLTTSGTRSVRAVLPGTMQWLNGLAASRDGSLYYSEDRAVRRIDARGGISTIANNVAVANCASIPGVEAKDGPYLRGLDVAADGTLFVAASGCGALLRISPRGQVTPILRTTAPWSPTAVVVAGNDLYVLEYLHTASDNRREWLPRVRKISSDGKVRVVASIDHR